MNSQSKINAETRGRPRKQQTRTLSPIFKQKFSDNSAIIHTSFLIYVFQIFVVTKNQKRVGHKDGGFTLYDKIDTQYCFDDIQEQLKNWGYQALFNNPNMRDLVKLLPALGPKIILKQICHLINFIVECQNQRQSEQSIYLQLTRQANQQKLNDTYPYMRFVPQALHQLKMDKGQKWDRNNNLQDVIRQRVNYLWEHLLRIIIHTVFNCLQGKISNKYFKPFFSDAQNPGDTYIGQLNLDQVVKKLQNPQRSNRGSQYNIEEQGFDKLRKMKSVVDADGTRTVVQIIKAPELLKNNNIQKIQSVFQSPVKIQRLQTQPLVLNKGFTSYMKPISFEGASQRKQQNENGISFKSSWKSIQKQKQNDANQVLSLNRNSLFKLPPSNSARKSSSNQEIKSSPQKNNQAERIINDKQSSQRAQLEVVAKNGQ